jgi:hypothetical protein
MKRTTMLLATMIAGATSLVTGCDDKAAPASEARPTATASAASATTAATAATPAAVPASAEPSASAASSASGPAKTYDCGAKGEKPCPMQGWMKAVMVKAAAGGDGAKLAQALTYVAAHPPPGYAGWTAMANAGVAKAKAGDLDGAKDSCKQCHDAYKESYKRTMRDQPF